MRVLRYFASLRKAFRTAFTQPELRVLKPLRSFHRCLPAGFALPAPPALPAVPLVRPLLPRYRAEPEHDWLAVCSPERPSTEVKRRRECVVRTVDRATVRRPLEVLDLLSSVEVSEEDKSAGEPAPHSALRGES